MNILYIAQSCDPYNGSEDQIGWSVPWEAAKEHSVHVITRTDLRPSIEQFLKTSEKRDIRMHYVDIPDIYKKVFKGPFYSGRLNIWHRRAYPMAVRLCKEHRIEIIHQITPVEFRSIGDYGRIEKVKYVCGPIAGGQSIDGPMMHYVRGKDRVIEGIRGVVNQIFRGKIRLDGRLKRCDYLLFANRETYAYMGGSEMDVESALCIDIGIGKTEINAPGRDEPHKELRILACGRLVYLKGYDFMLDVLEQLPEDLPYQCKIVGGGPLLEHLTLRCQSDRLAGRVEVAGPVPYSQMPEKYRWADVLLFPSLREATGTVILEALAQGVPVIAADRCGAATLLDESFGWRYTGRTLSEYKRNLGRILRECIHDPQTVAVRRKNANAAAACHTWEEKVKFYTQIYEQLLSEEEGKR